jgi:hypothetical protein
VPQRKDEEKCCHSDKSEANDENDSDKIEIQLPSP